MPAIRVIPDTKGWHDIRMKNVGASEVAALFNECSYLTRLELWLIKSGKIDDSFEENQRMYWGKKLEDAIADYVDQDNALRVENDNSYYTHDEIEGMGCTPDRFIYHPEKGRGVLEIKNIDGLQYREKWLDGEPPLMYLLQLQQQIDCTGLQWGMVAALVNGNELKMFEYDRHQPTIDKIEAEIKDFWQSVRDGVEPAAVAADYELLNKLNDKRNIEGVIDLSKDNQLPELCAEVVDAGTLRKKYEKEEKAAKAQIIQKIGSATRALCTGFDINYKQVVRQNKPKEASVSTFKQLRIKEQVS